MRTSTQHLWQSRNHKELDLCVMLRRTFDMKPFNWPEASRSETHASGREIYP